MRSRAVLGNKAYSPYTCPSNADYAICSVGLGPVSGGTVVIYPVKGGSLSTVASTATGIINRGNKSNLEFGKSILKNVSAKGGGCSFGTITNKPKNQPRSDFVN